MASGRGFHVASYKTRSGWQGYTVTFVFTGGYRFIPSDELPGSINTGLTHLLLDAIVADSTNPSF